MPTVTARPYHVADRDACLALFDGNVPRFFDPDERAGFADFLDTHAERWAYRVLASDGSVVACGGHAVIDDGTTADLCWGMVDRAHHGTGLGSLLTVARIDAARALPGMLRVRLDTSQHTAGFYHRFGFVTDAVVLDGYGPGLDRHEMTLTL